MAKRKKKKLRLKVNNFFLLIVIVLLIFFGIKKLLKVVNQNNKVTNKIKEVFNVEDEEKKLQEKLLTEYNNCLSLPYDENDNSEILNNKINEINDYIKNNYRASILYEDVNTGFTYKYNERQVYYGASLIKIVEAMYLLDKAELKEVDIYNTTIKYESKYIADFSAGMKTRNIGEEITLKDLIEYAVTYSDNSAHFMLSDYIGVSDLEEYAKNLGATEISVTTKDTFGNQNAVDTNIYLHHAYEIINSGTEYGEFLKKIMLNNDTNALNLTGGNNITVAHKYGQYDTVYHDIGIVFEQRPYYVSILTSHGNGKYLEIVNNISLKINELHHTFYEERESRCHTLIYGS